MTEPDGVAVGLSLQDIASGDGTFAVVALDQRNTLRRMYAAAGWPDVPDEELVAFKADVLGALGNASAVLVDGTYGVPARARAGATGTGLLIAAEPAVRATYGAEPRVTRDPGQDARWVQGLGGHALKFLAQIRVDRPGGSGPGGGPDLAAEGLDVVRAVLADCRAAGLPCVIENLTYPLPGEEPDVAARADAIIAAAVALDDLGPDLLKLEYPGSPEACRRLAGSIRTPWAVLSAGVGFDEFADVLRISCDEGGASGFIAGRAVWRDAVGMGPPERRRFLGDEGRRRLDACVAAIAGRARDWRSGS
jgi:tagatose 1,6-diphosphate aldolase/sulfofructosephosphate aldolase